MPPTGPDLGASLYTYRAKVVSIYDGDSLRADIDLGLGMWKHNERIRLAGIDTPEIRGAEREAGLTAKKFLVDMVEGRTVVIQTTKDKEGKYGRLLGVVWVRTEDGGYSNINELLVVKGMAVPYP